MGTNESKTEKRAERVSDLVRLVGVFLDGRGYPRITGKTAESRLEAALSCDGVLGAVSEFSDSWGRSLSVVRSSALQVDNTASEEGVVFFSSVVSMPCYHAIEKEPITVEMTTPFAAMIKGQGLGSYRKVVCNEIKITGRHFQLELWAPWETVNGVVIQRGDTIRLGPRDEIVRLAIPSALGGIDWRSDDIPAELCPRLGIEPIMDWPDGSPVSIGKSYSDGTSAWSPVSGEGRMAVYTAQDISEGMFVAAQDEMSSWAERPERPERDGNRKSA